MDSPLSLGSLAQSPAGDAPPTMRRLVYFVAGFDPRGVEGYYERMRVALAPFAEAGPIEKVDGCASRWRWRSPALGSQTTFEFLHWDDIVARHWRARSRLGVQVAAVRTLIVYWRCGLLARAGARARGARVARFVLLAMGLAPLAIAGAALIVAGAAGVLGASRLPLGGWCAVPALIGALWLGDRAWRWLNLDWLAKGFACVVETARGEAPDWRERCAAFAERIAEAEKQGEADEIVVVGHSLGAVLAMMAVAAWLDRGERPRRPILLATLGNVIPFYTWIEPGRRAMREGERVAVSPDVDWIDVTSGSDPASACAMGPLVGAGAEVFRWEPSFHHILTRERFRRIRLRPLDFHFQYLNGADQGDGFDFIRMMCSPRPFFSGAPR